MISKLDSPKEGLLLTSGEPRGLCFAWSSNIELGAVGNDEAVGKEEEEKEKGGEAIVEDKEEDEPEAEEGVENNKEGLGFFCCCWD